jgi:hypothetical protein
MRRSSSCTRSSGSGGGGGGVEEERLLVDLGEKTETGVSSVICGKAVEDN